MKKDKTKSRRALLTLGLSGSKLAEGSNDNNDRHIEKVKMLTPDGRLVEIDKSVLKNHASTKKTTNKDILEWSNKNIHKST